MSRRKVKSKKFPNIRKLKKKNKALNKKLKAPLKNLKV